MKKLEELGISPAPWRRDKWLDVSAGNGNWVAECASDPDHRLPEPDAANARLIAAAPDLYKALRECAVELAFAANLPKFQKHRKSNQWDYIIFKALEALEKAGGAE